ncbi:MAG: hybrid sensor histidine kinase/response regulator [Armatimonadota bacterium]
MLLINKVAEELTGWSQSDAMGKPLTDVYPTIDEKTRKRQVNPVDRVLSTGAIVDRVGHSLLLTRSGGEILVEDSGAPILDAIGYSIGMVLVFRDITSRRRVEQELRKADKLESIGILAGGIAHDFNNILTAIVGNLSLAKLNIVPEDPIYQRVEDAEKASMRARDLTQQLLTFSKGGAPIKRMCSITELLAEVSSFALLGSNVKCERQFQDGIWPVEVDEGQISQVISNMIINANQAMVSGGVITISIENQEIEEQEPLPLVPGSYVKITIADQGIGVPPENLAKIFDPYYTTKSMGSGLGLATSYSIIQHHGGCIHVTSELGVGTTFSIYLPASPSGYLPAFEKEEAPLISKGKVLVMDDEEIVREVVVNMLNALGYEASGAHNGEEALNLYEQSYLAGHPFDVVIMDLTVPGGLGGKETVKLLLEIDPHARAIASSGYSNDPVMARCQEYGFCAGIAKPYKLVDLARVLRTASRGAQQPAISEVNG